MSVEGRDPDEIKKEIDQVRTQLAATVDALAERVSPRRIVQCVKARVLAFLQKPVVNISLAVVGVLTVVLVARRICRR
jgi:hypothetical protein